MTEKKERKENNESSFPKKKDVNVTYPILNFSLKITSNPSKNSIGPKRLKKRDN